jgi:hypothetical protein
MIFEIAAEMRILALANSWNEEAQHKQDIIFCPKQ